MLILVQDENQSQFENYKQANTKARPKFIFICMKPRLVKWQSIANVHMELSNIRYAIYDNYMNDVSSTRVDQMFSK